MKNVPALCPHCRQQLYRWPGTTEFICATCDRITVTAPVAVALAPTLPLVRLPASAWPKPQPQRKAA